eukprot:TRINITY_DN5737_c0_g1_i4.p1 TRINITY_DN5737_c0_g1~~TRINITY_DN5737_c0_g1_i4.p1  ORF type:complete len:478 (+),score=131.21 TRINITY_DN5737_c0_g1_i4:49-1482(+)
MACRRRRKSLDRCWCIASIFAASSAADPWQRTPLHEAVEAGHLARAEQLLAEISAAAGGSGGGGGGSSSSRRDSGGDGTSSNISSSTSGGDGTSSNSSGVNARDALGWTPLHWAALHGSEELAQRLLEAKAAPDVEEFEFAGQPLHWAARRGHAKLLKLLLQHGASADAQDREGRDAFAWASLTGHGSEKIRKVLNGSAEVDDDPIEANLAKTGGEGHEYRDEMLRKMFPQADVDWKMSKLHSAAAASDVAAVKALLEDVAADAVSKKKVLSAKDHWHRTPLLAALQGSSGRKEKISEVASELIDSVLNLEDPEVILFSADPDGRNALHWAALSGETKVFAAVAQKGLGFRLDSSDRWGRSLMHHGSVNGHVDVLHAILNSKASDDVLAVINSKDSMQQAPLHLAAMSGHGDVVKFLIDKKAEVNLRDSIGRAPIHYACIVGSEKAVRALVGAKADPKMLDDTGRSAIKYATTFTVA